MKSENMFYWAFSQIFNWTNLRAFFSGNLADKELREVREAYAITARLYENSPYADEESPLSFTDEIVAEAARRANKELPEYLRVAFCEAVWGVLHDPPIIFSMPARPKFEALSLPELAEWRSFLLLKRRVLTDPERLVEVWREKIIRILEGLLGYFPSLAFEEQQGLFSVPLITLLSKPAEVIQRLVATFYDDDVVQAGLFHTQRKYFDNNLLRISGLSPDDAKRPRARIVTPESSNFAPPELLQFVAGTSFASLLETPMPFALPSHIRFEHMHIVAGTGHGKTQTLQHLILNDLKSENPPSMVIIDSQGDMLEKLSHLELFDTKLYDRLIYIDPTDTEFPPALNMFDVSRLKTLGPAAKEQALNGIIELYEYVFASLLRAELTQKQNVLFRYALRLMLAVPNATILDLTKVLHDPGPYLQYVDSLPETAREFFRTEFMDKSFFQTKQQIRRRIFGVLENDTFRRMFSTPQNRMRMDEALNSGKIILVNTAVDHLKKDSSSLLGRYFIALTLQAAQERAGMRSKHPAFLYIDEAAEYFDDNVDTLLNQARKQKVGVILAHQYMDQLTQGLRGSIAANTSIKLAGGVSDKDARALAPDMRCTSEFLSNQKRTNKSTSFACYVKNVTAQATSINVPFFALENEPRMGDGAFQNLIAENRERLSPAQAEESSTPPPDPTVAAKPPAQPRQPPPPQRRSALSEDENWSG